MFFDIKPSRTVETRMSNLTNTIFPTATRNNVMNCHLYPQNLSSIRDFFLLLTCLSKFSASSIHVAFLSSSSTLKPSTLLLQFQAIHSLIVPLPYLTPTQRSNTPPETIYVWHLLRPIWKILEKSILPQVQVPSQFVIAHHILGFMEWLFGLCTHIIAWAVNLHPASSASTASFSQCSLFMSTIFAFSDVSACNFYHLWHNPPDSCFNKSIIDNCTVPSRRSCRPSRSVLSSLPVSLHSTKCDDLSECAREHDSAPEEGRITNNFINLKYFFISSYWVWKPHGYHVHFCHDNLFCSILIFLLFSIR